MTDSKSLWNFAPSPGWTQQQLQILRFALMKFGVGRWKKIVDSNCLPNKTVSQMYMQTQRLLGQQSLCQFMGLHVDVNEVNDYNRQQIGPQIFRKQGLIINTDIDYNRAAKLRVRKQNAIKYGLSSHDIKKIELPNMRTKHSLKDILLWKKYFRKHKPPTLIALHKICQLIKDTDVFIEVLKNQKKNQKNKKFFGNNVDAEEDDDYDHFGEEFKDEYGVECQVKIQIDKFKDQDQGIRYKFTMKEQQQ